MVCTPMHGDGPFAVAGVSCSEGGRERMQSAHGARSASALWASKVVEGSFVPFAYSDKSGIAGRVNCKRGDVVSDEFNETLECETVGNAWLEDALGRRDDHLVERVSDAFHRRRRWVGVPCHTRVQQPRLRSRGVGKGDGCSQPVHRLAVVLVHGVGGGAEADRVDRDTQGIGVFDERVEVDGGLGIGAIGTTLYSSQQLADVNRIADQLVVVHGGEVVRHGPTGSLVGDHCNLEESLEAWRVL